MNQNVTKCQRFEKFPSNVKKFPKDFKKFPTVVKKLHPKSCSWTNLSKMNQNVTKWPKIDEVDPDSENYILNFICHTTKNSSLTQTWMPLMDNLNLSLSLSLSLSISHACTHTHTHTHTHTNTDTHNLWMMMIVIIMIMMMVMNGNGEW